VVAIVALWGDDHPDLGRIRDERLDERTALALSRGRFPKPYAHVDPNEDAVLAACGSGGWLLAVADGHFGFDAARAALGAVEARGDALVGAPLRRPEMELRELCAAAQDAVVKALEHAVEPRTGSRTALTVALATDADLHVVTYGDTVCVRARGGRGKVVGRGHAFLGPGTVVPPVTRARLRPRDRVAVASDGLTDYLGHDWTHRIAGVLCGSHDPQVAARHLVELAGAGGAGDNVAVAVRLS